SAGLVDGRDLQGELLIVGGVIVRPARQPHVVDAPRDLQDPAEDTDRRQGLLRRDAREPHVLSLAKKAAAFFNISRSRRSVLTSRLRANSSSRSVVVSAPGGPLPSSISARRIHARTDVSVRSRSRATSPAFLPLLRNSPTTSALYSGVKCLRFFFAAMNTSRPAHRGPSLVSTKPGQDQRERKDRVASHLF